MAQAATTSCDICMRALNLHHCIQCDQNFCDECKVAHLRSKVSANHMFTAGGCTDHNKDCIYNCEDCDQLICKVCANKAHKKHDFVNIKDSNQKVQTDRNIKAFGLQGL